MDLAEQVFRYCERGQDPAFWAEPFNAWSNIAFLVAALLLARRMPHREGELSAGARLSLYALIAIVASIGLGSFVFHTVATRWAQTLDVVPIGVFMGGYLVVALRVFFGLGWALTGALVAAFLGASGAMGSIACPASLRSVTDFAREPCLKGSMGYVPALAALIVTGLLLHRGHPAGASVLAAAGLMAAALLLRWLDRDLCAATVLLGRARGTHALWHLVNAATVYVLVSAAMQGMARPRS